MFHCLSDLLFDGVSDALRDCECLLVAFGCVIVIGWLCGGLIECVFGWLICCVVACLVC